MNTRTFNQKIKNGKSYLRLSKKYVILKTTVGNKTKHYISYPHIKSSIKSTSEILP